MHVGELGCFTGTYGVGHSPSGFYEMLFAIIITPASISIMADTPTHLFALEGTPVTPLVRSDESGCGGEL